MIVLGIESSCDETAVALVENGKRILSNAVASSLRLHQQYGGVVPEIATRYHVESINYVLADALAKAKKKLSDLDLIACVYGPGLAGALLIGLSLAKALSLSLGAGLIGINHIQAHLYAALMGEKQVRFPFIGLVISGGHTNLFYVKGYCSWQMLGKTRDDAAGEAFDKVAKLLKLGYPGGPLIERIARNSCPNNIRFPRTNLGNDSLDFSFSGLKTAVLYYLKDQQKAISRKQQADIAAGFQEAVIDTISAQALKACRLKKARRVVVGGGVAANQRLRQVLTKNLAEQGIGVYIPEPLLCQDNAAMVAGLGYQLYKKGRRSNLNLEIEPNLT